MAFRRRQCCAQARGNRRSYIAHIYPSQFTARGNAGTSDNERRIHLSQLWKITMRAARFDVRYYWALPISAEAETGFSARYESGAYNSCLFLTFTLVEQFIDPVLRIVRQSLQQIASLLAQSVIRRILQHDGDDSACIPSIGLPRFDFSRFIKLN